jgi:hypothetical protein
MDGIPCIDSSRYFYADGFERQAIGERQLEMSQRL